MGEDTAELLLAIEDAFQIEIAERELGYIATVGDLRDLVISKLQGQNSKRCLTSAAFYRTRRGMIDALGIDRRQIRPSTPLAPLLPRRNRRRMWRSIQGAMELKLPDLRGSLWIALFALALGIALPTGIAFRAGIGSGWIGVVLFLGLIVGGLLIRLARPLEVVIPNGATTVGDLARDVLALNHARLVEEAGGWNKDEVWESLCRVIVNQTAVPREKIRPEATISYDLGID
ncbi:MAG: hypothetical protein ACLQGV_09240 [Bryobacteraceae bacterium]